MFLRVAEVVRSAALVAETDTIRGAAYTFNARIGAGTIGVVHAGNLAINATILAIAYLALRAARSVTA